MLQVHLGNISRNAKHYSIRFLEESLDETIHLTMSANFSVIVMPLFYVACIVCIREHLTVVSGNKHFEANLF